MVHTSSTLLVAAVAISAASTFAAPIGHPDVFDLSERSLEWDDELFARDWQSDFQTLEKDWTNEEKVQKAEMAAQRVATPKLSTSGRISRPESPLSSTRKPAKEGAITGASSRLGGLSESRRRPPPLPLDRPKGGSRKLEQGLKSERLSKTPKSERLSKTPKSERLTKTPKNERLTKTPKNERLTKALKTEKIAKTLKGERLTKTPQSSRLGKAPKSAKESVLGSKGKVSPSLISAKGKGKISPSLSKIPVQPNYNKILSNDFSKLRADMAADQKFLAGNKTPVSPKWVTSSGAPVRPVSFMPIRAPSTPKTPVTAKKGKRDYDEELFARDFDEEEDIFARYFDDDEEVFARDFDDEEEMFAREFDDEDIFARDFDDDEDIFAREFDDEEIFEREYLIDELD